MSVFGDSNAKRIIDELRAEVEKMASQRDEWRERAIERGNERDVAEGRVSELRAEVERAASINAELRRDLTSSRDNGSNMAVEIGVLRARAEAAEAELARLRPVVEAASRWCEGESCQCPGGKLDPHLTDCPWQRVEQRLFDATMDALRAAEGGDAHAR